MTTERYDYSPIAQHPQLVACYCGWLGQKICALAHIAILQDRSDLWLQASAEVDRLTLVLHDAGQAGHLDLSGETGEALGELIGHYADGGWWTSTEGTRERAAHHRERRELAGLPDHGDHEPDLREMAFQPRLVLASDAQYAVAGTVTSQLDGALMQAAAAMEALDVCRLGVLLAGSCYRDTPRLGVRFINSVLNDLAAHGLTDLHAENEFRRAVGLSEMGADRRPQSISTPVIMPPPLPTEDAGPVPSGDPFSPTVGPLGDYCDLILACVFRRFDVAVPPAENDAAQHPELMELKTALRDIPDKVAEASPGGKSDAQPAKGAAVDRGHFWTDEAAEYLGADQLGVDPRKFMYRLVRKGALPEKKINGRFVFYKADLDRVIANGDHKRGRGRPRKLHSA